MIADYNVSDIPGHVQEVEKEIGLRGIVEQLSRSRCSQVRGSVRGFDELDDQALADTEPGIRELAGYVLQARQQGGMAGFQVDDSLYPDHKYNTNTSYFRVKKE